jgi:primase-polymerase (primpol)-like protein
MTIGINKHEVGDSNPAIKPALQPRFCDIPEELKRLPRWVVSKGKKPFCAEAINLPASVNDPDTWSSFEAAQTAYEEDGWDGIGFVFNGDGIAGVDLDKCVVDGVPSNAALEILDEIGCQYVEFSQSGTGLHAYGHVDCTTLKGRRGTYKGIKTELYTSGRFFIVTGNVFRSGPLPWLNGYQSVHDQIDSRTTSCGPPSPTKTEETEAIASVPSVSSVSSVSSVQLFKGCIPKQVGTRHDCIFKLARHLKADQPSATVLERKAVLSAWWNGRISWWHGTA